MGHNQSAVPTPKKKPPIAMGADAWDYIVQHVIMPPKLPQGDNQGGENDLALATFVQDAGEEFRAQLKGADVEVWKPIQKMLGHFVELNHEHGFNSATVKDILRNLGNGGASRSNYPTALIVS